MFVLVGPSWPPGAACPGPASPPSAAASTGWQSSLITVIRSISSRGNHGRIGKSGSSTSSYTDTFSTFLLFYVLGYQTTYPKCYLIVTEDNFQTCKKYIYIYSCFLCVSPFRHLTTWGLLGICTCSRAVEYFELFKIFKIVSCFAIK
jgi:hypothetical protein